MCQCVRVTFVIFADYESWTRLISTNPGFMEVDEYGLTRGTCFVAHRLEVAAVAGLLWISWCVLGGSDFFVCFSFLFFFFFERTRPAANMRPPCLVYFSTSNEARPMERGDRGRFAYRPKSLFIPGVRTWCQSSRDRFLPLRQKSLFIPGCVQGDHI